MNKLLSYYTSLFGTSGSERDIRQGIINEIKSYAQVKVDRLGNIIALKRGENPDFPIKVMVDAHMDEVGLMVTTITDEGYLKFDKIGGIDDRTLLSKQVIIGKNKIKGVIGRTAPHLLTKDDEQKVVKHSDMYIDIGAKNKKDAEQYVKIGDVVGCATSYAEFGEGLVRAKALDDRVGCQILTELIQGSVPFDTYFVFSVMEEIGCIGAGCAANEIKPDYCIVVEGTTAQDTQDDSRHSDVCKLGFGPAISFMDGSTVYDSSFLKLAFDAAKEHGIEYQLKRAVAGGNNAGRVQRTLSGINTLAISVPVRYIHTPCSVASLDDIEQTKRLVSAVLNRIATI